MFRNIRNNSIRYPDSNFGKRSNNKNKDNSQNRCQIQIMVNPIKVVFSNKRIPGVINRVAQNKVDISPREYRDRSRKKSLCKRMKSESKEMLF